MPSITTPQDAPLVVHATEIASRPSETFPTPSSDEPGVGGKVTWHTLFSAPSTSTSAMCAGIGSCVPWTGHLCAHRHEQPEIYHVTEGQGIVTIDGKDYLVSKGSSVFIPGNAEHGIRNEGDVDLKWFYVFPTASFEDVIYRFS